MRGAVVKKSFNSLNARFRVAVVRFLYGRLRGQSFVAERVIVAGDGLNGQARVFKQRCATNFAGDDFD